MAKGLVQSHTFEEVLALRLFAIGSTKMAAIIVPCSDLLRWHRFEVIRKSPSLPRNEGLSTDLGVRDPREPSGPFLGIPGPGLLGHALRVIPVPKGVQPIQGLDTRC